MDNREYEDCYYFLHSNCKKGLECVYRHNAKAKTSNALCPEWANTKKCTVDCPMRHSLYHLNKKKNEEMCFFETTEQGCTKPYCEFRHRDASKDAWKNELNKEKPYNEPTEPCNRPWMHEKVDDSLQFKKVQGVNKEEELKDKSTDDSEFYRKLQNENKELPHRIYAIENEIKQLEEYFMRNNRNW